MGQPLETDLGLSLCVNPRIQTSPGTPSKIDAIVRYILLDNDLDTNGLIQWIDTTTKEYAYKIRYVDALGKIMSKQTYTKKLKNNEKVYICAFVGCTYHCG